MSKGDRLRIIGNVQGVGFRPHVWALARRHGLTGRVRNEGGSVVVELWGEKAQRDAVISKLRSNPPVLARIDSLEIVPIDSCPSPDDFVIEPSREGDVTSGAGADTALCSECRQEMQQPGNRRYRYPFTNCTHCGPRFTITRALPYDRATTSMSSFPLCESCSDEYVDPADRRFHAQATACSGCGPEVWLCDEQGAVIAASQDDVIKQCAERIVEGAIVAIKGVGGFHLACDATSEEAVMCLRQRKRRPDKPFAVMSTDIAMAKSHMFINEVEERELQSPVAPIVLLKRRAGSAVAENVAPGLDTVGGMLAYSGLHHLLIDAVGRPLVMTSGNRGGELLLADNEEALAELVGIADFFLFHDREIVNRVDDSVVRVIAGKRRLLRRARGYVPNTIILPEGFESADGVLAMGAEMKNSFCLLHLGRAIPSHHMGELTSLSNFEHYRKTINDMSELLHFSPGLIAVDAHPGYHATQLGEGIAKSKGVSLRKIHHHHAHIATCMTEHGLPLASKPILGIALDGLGYGGDGTLWGGEFLLAGYRDYTRLAAFDAVALPGGDAANREPWRNTFAHLQHAIGWERVVEEYGALPAIKRLQEKPVTMLSTMIDKGMNSPLSSSCGRLFDAVAALLGICFDAMSYEGQAAMELEQLADSCFADEIPYPSGLHEEAGLGRIAWAPLWQALLNDLLGGVSVARIAARFHHGLIDAVARQTTELMLTYSFDTVVLSGGVFQNRFIAEGIIDRLEAKGLRVLLPAALPANDGGIALGQAMIAFAGSLSETASTPATVAVQSP